MSKQVARSGLDIIAEMLKLTREMADSNDADYLIESIDKRGELMDEYDALKKNPASAAEIEDNKPKISKMLNEMIALDKKISDMIGFFYHEAKTELQASAKKSKVLNYTNQAISASGSYMDYKE